MDHSAPSWPDRRILDLFGISIPILQAPMAGASTPQMARAVSAAGGLTQVVVKGEPRFFTGAR